MCERDCVCKGKPDHNFCLEQLKAANESIVAERSSLWVVQ